MGWNKLRPGERVQRTQHLDRAGMLSKDLQLLGGGRPQPIFRNDFTQVFGRKVATAISL
jgi:hypothetical protein